MINVIEIFDSIQGEVDTGMPATFVRVAECDMVPPCEWCDTKYALHSENLLGAFTSDELAYFLDERGTTLDNIVWTGGSPSLYMEEIFECIRVLHGPKMDSLMCGKYHHYLETNGLQSFEDIGSYFYGVSVSPKKQNYNIESLRHYRDEGCRFKFVYESEDELWWEPILEELHIVDDDVYIMPEGQTRDAQLRKMPEVIDYCMSKGYNFCPRLHVLVWDTKRGV